MKQAGTNHKPRNEKEAINRTLMSVVAGAKKYELGAVCGLYDEIEVDDVEGSVGHIEDFDIIKRSDLIAAVRKAFNAGRRFGQREMLRDGVDNT